MSTNEQRNTRRKWKRRGAAEAVTLTVGGPTRPTKIEVKEPRSSTPSRGNSRQRRTKENRNRSRSAGGRSNRGILKPQMRHVANMAQNAPKSRANMKELGLPNGKRRQVTAAMLQTLLPGDLEINSFPTRHDEFDPVCFSKLTDVNQINLSSLVEYIGAAATANEAPFYERGTKVWNLPSTTTYPIVHVQDPRIYAITPMQTWANLTTPAINTYTSYGLGNLDRIDGIWAPSYVNIARTANFMFRLTPDTFSTVMTKRMRRLEVLSSDHECEQKLQDVEAVPNALYFFNTVAEESYFKLVDLSFTSVTGGGVENPYGPIHPVVHFYQGDTLIPTYWVDCNVTGTAVDITFNVVSYIETTDVKVYTATSSPTGTGLLGVDADFYISARRVDFTANELVVQEKAKLVTATASVSPGGPITFSGHLDGSGYYCFTPVGRLATTNVINLNPAYIGFNLVTLRIQSLTKIASRHWINPRYVVTSDPGSSGNDEAATTIKKHTCIGNSLLITNTSAEIAKGGSVVAYAFDEDTMWATKTSLGQSALFSTNMQDQTNAFKHGFENGTYSVIRHKIFPKKSRAAWYYNTPSSNQTQICSSLAFAGQEGKVIVKPYNIMFITLASTTSPLSAPTTIMVTSTQTVQWTTRSQMYQPRRVPHWQDQEMDQFLELLKRHPIFAENPWHFLQVLRDFGKMVQGAAGKAAPYLQSIGGALSVIPLPGVSEVGTGINTAGTIADFISKL